MVSQYAHRNLRFIPFWGTASYGALIVYTLLSIFPFLWMVSASLKESTEVYQNPSLIPWNPRLDTLIKTWNNLNFFTHFLNTLFLTVIVVVGILVIYSLAGYGFAVLPFRGHKVLLFFFLSMLLVPGVTILIPLYAMLRIQVPLIGPNASYLSTYIGMALPMINGAGPFAIFLFRNYFRSIPHELHEAAKVDGCGEFRIYWNIYVPLALPAIATVGIMNVLSTWNAYVWPSLVITKPEWMTLPLKLRELDLQQVIQWDVRMAGSLFTVIPIIIVFMLFQRNYIAGLVGGAVKG